MRKTILILFLTVSSLHLFSQQDSVADVSAQSYNSKSTDISPLSEQKNKRNNQSLAIIAGIGTGRLENITDMQNALWLNKALEKEGRLSRTLSAGELNCLGRVITAANNTRVPDARKRTQFILEIIDGYFQQNGLINKTDIKYFSNLNDIAFFAFNETRFLNSLLMKKTRARPLPGQLFYLWASPNMFQ